MLQMTRADLELIIDHCIAGLPDEACGLLASREGRVTRVYPMRNARPGPASYEMEPEEQFRVLKEIRQAGWTLGGVYHSHTSSPSYPSGIDVERAYWPGTLFPNYPGAVHVIVSLMDRPRVAVKGFTISDQRVDEVRVLIDA